MDFKVESDTVYWRVRGADTWNPFKQKITYTDDIYNITSSCSGAMSRGNYIAGGSVSCNTKFYVRIKNESISLISFSLSCSASCSNDEGGGLAFTSRGSYSNETYTITQIDSTTFKLSSSCSGVMPNGNFIAGGWVSASINITFNISNGDIIISSFSLSCSASCANGESGGLAFTSTGSYSTNTFSSVIIDG